MKVFNSNMLLLRSSIFFIFIVLWTLLIGVFGSLSILTFSQKTVCYVTYVWAVVIDKALRVICGVQVRVEGKDNLPKNKGLIVASRHQSVWETIYFLKLFKNPIAILKKELTYIPIYGWYLPLMGMASIDRKAGKNAIKKLMKAVEKAVRQDRVLLIFPEGTRVKPGQTVEIKPGIAAIHKALPWAPIVPIVLNSGKIWPARSWLIRPGTITLKILDPITGTFSKDELLQKLQKVINYEAKLID